MESDLEAVLQGGKETGSVERGNVWVLAPVALAVAQWMSCDGWAPPWRGWYGGGMNLTEGGK